MEQLAPISNAGSFYYTAEQFRPFETIDLEPYLPTILDKFDSVPKELYHYTSAIGMAGIHHSKHFWASSVFHMNDSQEVSYFRVVVNPILREMVQDGRLSEAAARDLGLRPAAILHLNTVAVCLSERGNHLTQWRAYAPINGFSLGVRVHEWLRDTRSILLQCVYNINQQRDLARAVVNQLVQEDQFGDNSLTAAMFVLLALCCKHPSFEDEKEWRLVRLMVPSQELRLRNSSIGLLPYLPISACDNAGRLALSNIYVGPTPHPALAVVTARTMFGCHAMDSGVPYRAW